MMRYYCTYFDKNYLIKGLGLIESLNRHENNDFQIFVVCLDELTRTILNKLNIQNVKTIPLHEIEQRDFPLLEAKQNRSLVEYYWTLTATVTLRILERYPEIDVLTYLDADLFFYSSPDPIFDELGNQSILIHEHRFSPSQAHLEAYGKYNVGLLCFRNDPNGVGALKWWRDRCIEWCYARREDGKYADQLYLDDWPTRFKQVVVLQNIGAGVGPWNHIQYNFDKVAGDCPVRVNNIPLVFYHFHSLAFVAPQVIIPSKYIINPFTKDILRLCFVPYLNTLSELLGGVRAVLPDFDFGVKHEAVIYYRHTFLARAEMRPQLEKSAISQFKISLDRDWDCYCSDQLMEFSTRIDKINTVIEAGETAVALSSVRDALTEFPDAPHLLALQAELEYAGNEREKALEKLLGSYPNCARAHSSLGVLYHRGNNEDKARYHYEKAAGLEPQNTIYQKALADFYYVVSGQTEEALQLYLKIFTINPVFIENLLMLGHICVSLKKFDKAKAFYKRILQIDPGNGEAMKFIRDLVSGVSNQEEKRAELKSASLLFNNEKTNKKWPRISIVTPSFNQGQFLEECIDSVLSQNYPNLEYIIMDGGSSDDSVEIIRKYEKHLTYWQSRPDEGQYAAINEGFKRTTGTIMTWLNSDDKFHPNAFKIVSSIFLQREDIEWIMGRPNEFDIQGRQFFIMEPLPIWSSEKYLKKEYKDPFIQQEGTFWRRSLWEKAGGKLNVKLRLAGDLELWARFFRYAQLVTVDALLAGYRHHLNNKAQVSMNEYITEAEKILDREIHLFKSGKYNELLPPPEPILRSAIVKIVSQATKKLKNPDDKLLETDGDERNSSNEYLVSAIVSTYNSKRFIGGCIEDLEAQSISGNIEIIIVDSGSEQDEQAIVNEFQKRYTNIKYIRTENRETVYGAWNRGIKIATAKYITTANTDDRHRKDALEQMVNVLEMRSDIALVYADVIKTETENEAFECCTELGRYQWYDWDRNILLDKGCFIGPQPMWRRDVHRLYGYFDDSMVSSGDYEFWLRISQTYDFFHLRMPLGLFLLRSDSIENRERETKSIEDLKITNLYKKAAERGVIIRCRPLEELNHYIKDSKGNDKSILGQLIEEIQRLADLKTDRLAVDELWSAEDEARLERAMKDNEYVEAFRLLKKAILFGHHENNHIDALFQVTSKIILKHTNWFNSRGNHITSNSYPVKQLSEDKMAFVNAQHINAIRKNIQGGVIMESAEKIYQGIQAMINSNNPEAAIWALERLLETYPDYALACNDLGVLYYNHGNKEKALEYYEKAAQLSPENITFQKNLADFYYVEQVRIQEALEIYVKVLAAHPEDIETLLIIGHICVSLKKFEDARVFYNRVLELEPWNLEAQEHLDKMAEYEEGGAAKSAEEMYQNIQESMNTSTPEEAINKLQELLSLHPDYALAHNDLGVLFYNQGNKEQALRHYEQAASLQPDNITFQKNLADFYYVEQSRVQEALEIYVKVLSAHPEDVETLLITGHICVSLKKFEDARVFYNRVLELEPWNIDARQNLNKLEDYEQGKTTFEAASALAN